MKRKMKLKITENMPAVRWTNQRKSLCRSQAKPQQNIEITQENEADATGG